MAKSAKYNLSSTQSESQKVNRGRFDGVRPSAQILRSIGEIGGVCISFVTAFALMRLTCHDGGAERRADKTTKHTTQQIKRMNMNKFTWMALVAAGVLVAGAPSSPAQDRPPRPENRPDRPAGAQGGQGARERQAQLLEQLNLTADQKQKVEALMKEQREKNAGLRDLPQEERRVKMQESRKEMDAKMKEILTAEQYEKWTKLREENRRGGPGGPGGPRGENRPAPDKPAEKN